MTTQLTDTTLAAFLVKADALRPGSSKEAEAALRNLIRWSLEQRPPLTALPAGDQSTVAFGFDGDHVFWRGYPGKGTEHKLTVLPGLRDSLPKGARLALVAALEAAVPRPEIPPHAHLQCNLGPLADRDCFERFSVFLASGFAVGQDYFAGER